MRIHVQKWGNSLALRIPHALARESHLTQGAEVELALINGKLVIEPISPPRYTLEALLAGITPENSHPTVEMDPAVGQEVW